MRSRVLVNPLGDVRAEADHGMLSQAFFETPDYLSLLESDDKVVVVGRRGTGKSALAFRLARQWGAVKGNALVQIAPDEHEALALAPLIRRTGSRFLGIRAATRLLWRYGLLLETAQILSTRYKAKDLVSSSELLLAHLHEWGKADQAFFDKQRALLRRHLTADLAESDVMGKLVDALQISKIEKEVRAALEPITSIKILIDRLDEGFEPSEEGIAFIDGVVTAAIDIATSFRGKIRPVVFLRDNIFRAVALYDQDFTRNIEGQTLRLHWDVNTLFYLVCNRIRTAFHDPIENNKRLWNKYCSYDLQNDDGFRQCLQFTLYRPAIRNGRLGRVISELAKIEPGIDDSAHYEDWCLEAIRICFAAKLDNVELHPNKNSTSRRDIVGTNAASSVFWRRVREDYESRQVIFEVKNYETLTPDDYRQILSYLSGSYGRLAFVIARGTSTALEREKELDWLRSIYHEHKKIIIKLTGKFLTDILSKLRNPQKHDAGDNLLSGLLDTYERLYLSIGMRPAASKRARRRA